jgi:hypothetical protein
MSKICSVCGIRDVCNSLLFSNYRRNLRENCPYFYFLFHIKCQICLQLRGEHKIEVLENRVLKGILVSKTADVAGARKNLHEQVGPCYGSGG